MSDNSLPSIERLRWQCRRGMLELDCVLLDFLENKYEQQPDDIKQLFVTLLSAEDPQLNTWVMSGEFPDDKGIAKIAKLVRGI